MVYHSGRPSTIVVVVVVVVVVGWRLLLPSYPHFIFPIVFAVTHGGILNIYYIYTRIALTDGDPQQVALSLHSSYSLFVLHLYLTYGGNLNVIYANANCPVRQSVRPPTSGTCVAINLSASSYIYQPRLSDMVGDPQ